MTKEGQRECARKIASKACNSHLDGAVCVFQHTLLACMLQLSLAPNNDADMGEAISGNAALADTAPMTLMMQMGAQILLDAHSGRAKKVAKSDAGRNEIVTWSGVGE